MPVELTKLRGGKYKVATAGGTKAKGTTKKKAKAQERLLYGIDKGWAPTKGGKK